MEPLRSIDKIDRQILACLTEDARMSHSDIAKRINVSPGTVHGRVKKLEQRKIILSSSLRINYDVVGYSFTA